MTDDYEVVKRNTKVIESYGWLWELKLAEEDNEQIDEMAKDIYSLLRSDTMSRALASLLYGEGYRKCKEDKT